MRFLVIERVTHAGRHNTDEFVKLARADLEYKAGLQKKGKIVGGPFLDILGEGYILETETMEEMGEIFFNSPANMITDREVHPLGTFQDSLEGMEELSKQ